MALTFSELEQLVKNQPELMQNVKEAWVVFDRKNNPYLGIPMLHEGVAQKVTGMHVANIYFYPFSQQPFHIQDHVAKLSYYYYALDKAAGLYLDRVVVNQEISKNGLGSQLLHVINHIAFNANINKITGRFDPLTYAENNSKGVENFYNKNGYDVNKETKHLSKLIQKKEMKHLQQNTLNTAVGNTLFHVQCNELSLTPWEQYQ